MEIVNFNDAKPDPKIRLTNYDKNNAAYLFDIFDKMIAETFVEESKAIFDKYKGKKNITNNETDPPADAEALK